MEFAASGGESTRSPERLTAAFFQHLGERLRVALSAEQDRTATATRLLETAIRLAAATGQNRLYSILHRDRVRLLDSGSLSVSERRTASTDRSTKEDQRRSRESPRRSEMKQKTNPRRKTTPLEEPEEFSDPLYIENAGLVLTGNFLPRLFQSLQMLQNMEDGGIRLRDSETASRAVHLLQYLVDGRPSAPEPLLVLNKILCGIPLSEPIDPEIEMTDRETEFCDMLLNSVIAHWEIIKGTSITGLRETFLQREGRLELSDNGWQLQVQRKTVDVLVDQIPWSFSVLHHGWMAQPVYVKW